VTGKNAVFWDVTLCGSCKNSNFRGRYRLHRQGEKNGDLRTTLILTRNRCVPPKRWFLQELHAVTYHKRAFLEEQGV
jgi:hypothetical protein